MSHNRRLNKKAILAVETLLDLVDDALGEILSWLPIYQLLSFYVSRRFYNIALKNINARLKIKSLAEFNEKMHQLGNEQIQQFVLAAYYDFTMAEKVKGALVMEPGERLQAILSSAEMEVIIEEDKRNSFTLLHHESPLVSSEIIMLLCARLITIDIIKDFSKEYLTFLIEGMSLLRKRILTQEHVAMIDISFLQLVLKYKKEIYQYALQSEKKKTNKSVECIQVEIDRAFKKLMRKYVDFAWAITDRVGYEYAGDSNNAVDPSVLEVDVASDIRQRFESLLKHPMFLAKDILTPQHVDNMPLDRLILLIDCYLLSEKNIALISPEQAMSFADGGLERFLKPIMVMEGEHFISSVMRKANKSKLFREKFELLQLGSVFPEHRTQDAGMTYWYSLFKNVRHFLKQLVGHKSIQGWKPDPALLNILLTDGGLSAIQEKLIDGWNFIRCAQEHADAGYSLSALEKLFLDQHLTEVRRGIFKDKESIELYFGRLKAAAIFSNVNPLPSTYYDNASRTFRQHGKFFHFTLLDLLQKQAFNFSEIEDICGADFIRGKLLYLIAVAIQGRFITPHDVLYASSKEPNVLFEIIRKKMSKKAFNLYLDLYYRFLTDFGELDDDVMRSCLGLNIKHVPFMLFEDSFSSLILKICKINVDVGIEVNLIAVQLGVDFLSLADKYNAVIYPRCYTGLTSEYSDYEHDIVLLIKDHLDSYSDPGKFLTSYSKSTLFQDNHKNHMQVVSALLKKEKYQALNRDLLIEFFGELIAKVGLDNLNKKGSLYAIITIASFLLRVDLFAPELKSALILSKPGW